MDLLTNIHVTTTVTTSNRKSSSLRTTIPDVITQLFKLVPGDTLSWTISKESTIIITKVEKHARNNE